MQTIVYQCDTAMPAQKLPNCCHDISIKYKYSFQFTQSLINEKTVNFSLITVACTRAFGF